MIKDASGNQRFFGVYRGVVTDVSDPSGAGRIKMQIPQLLGEESTGWAWPINPPGVEFALPDIGQGVWAMFEGGDPSFPVWSGTFGAWLGSGNKAYLKPLPSGTSTSSLYAYRGLANGDKQLDVTETLSNLINKKYYGSFYDTTTQVAVANTPTKLKVGTTQFSKGVRIVDGTKITLDNLGVYNIQFSAQLDKTDSGTDTVDIWLRHNGVDVPFSNTRLSLPGNNSKIIAAWNWFVECDTTQQYYEIMWATGDVNLRIYGQAAQTSPFAAPGIPGVILTVDAVDVS